MNLQIYNRELCVESIRVIGVSSSSMIIVGDSNTIQTASTFDTPPESLIIGPLVPLVR